MPRNATKKGSKQEHQEKFPLKVYNKLQLTRQIACYNFWLHLITCGQEGWSPTDTPGSVYHCRESNYIKRNIKESSWPKIGKVRSSSGSFDAVLILVSLPHTFLSEDISCLGYGKSCYRSK